MRLNINHSKNNIIGGFKLPYSLNGSPHNRSKWVDENDTKEVENLTGGLFINYLRKIEKRQIVYFSHNARDENKNPDIFIHFEGYNQSVQITQIVLNDYLKKFNQTKKLCIKISKLIAEIYKPSIKINIQIYPPWGIEEPTRSSGAVHKRAAKLIANTISENIGTLCSERKYLNFHLDKKIFKNFADGYNLFPVPHTHQSNYFGDNNVYVDYEFDDIRISEEDIHNSVNKVYNNKNGGNSDILLIWGDRNHLMGTETMIFKNLQEKFKNSTFKSVYFMCFENIKKVEKRMIFCSKVCETK